MLSDNTGGLLGLKDGVAHIVPLNEGAHPPGATPGGNPPCISGLERASNRSHTPRQQPHKRGVWAGGSGLAQQPPCTDSGRKRHFFDGAVDCLAEP